MPSQKKENLQLWRWWQLLFDIELARRLRNLTTTPVHLQLSLPMAVCFGSYLEARSGLQQGKLLEFDEFWSKGFSAISLIACVFTMLVKITGWRERAETFRVNGHRIWRYK